MDGTGNHTTVGSNKTIPGTSRSSSPCSSIADTTLGDPSDNPSDTGIRPNNPFDTPSPSRTATTALKSNAVSTPMTKKGSTSAATQPEIPELSKDGGLDEDMDDDGWNHISGEDLARRITYSGEDFLTMSEAIDRAEVMIPVDLALQRATMQKIKQFFATSDWNPKGGSRVFMFHKSEFLRCITEKAQRAHRQYLETRDNVTGLPSKAEVLAIRFCNPHEMAPIADPLNGYLLAMNRIDLAQVGVFETREQTLLGALVSHFKTEDDMMKVVADEMKVVMGDMKVAMGDMTKRIHALETSARPQLLEYVINKSDIMETAIQDFRVSVKGALDRRITKDDLTKIMSKYDKDLVDLHHLFKRSNVDRDTPKDNLDATRKHFKDLHDLAGKNLQDLRNIDNQLQDSFRRQAPADHGTNIRQAPKRPSDDAHRADENQPKKRRLDATMKKMDFSDIV